MTQPSTDVRELPYSLGMLERRRKDAEARDGFAEICIEEIDELKAAIESLLSHIEKLEELVGKARIDVLVTLGAVRDQMPSEAVAIFQRIAKDFEEALRAHSTVRG
jgi:hypothetical protein